jgi:pSer/pThr/pTyr-binding forkhead associated (FHA) protein
MALDLPVPGKKSPATSRQAQSSGVLTLASAPTTEIVVVAAAVVSAGRLSTHALCLRCEPTTEPRNHDATLRISSTHLQFAYRASHVELTDLGSGNGTKVDGEALIVNRPFRLGRPVEIDIAGVLRLRAEPVARQETSRRVSEPTDPQLGSDSPGSVAFLRVRRLNNLATRSYALLYHSALIGDHEDALVRISEQRRVSRSRGLDFGGTPQSPVATAELRVRDGGLWLAPCTGELLVDGRPVSTEESPLTQDHTIAVGGTELIFKSLTPRG